jgi:HTH-type transcriptional regulator/antitoxin HigA
MPTAAYAALLSETDPQVIETEERYEKTSRRVGELIRKGSKRTQAETKLMRLLAVLMEDYDRRHALPSEDWTPAERLQYVLENSGKTRHDLLPVFGQRSHVHEALTGGRPISSAHAQKLADLFRLKPSVFL